MAIPFPQNSNLEIRLSAEGRLQAYWKGDRLPTNEIQISWDLGNRACITLSFSGLQVKLATEVAEGK